MPKVIEGGFGKKKDEDKMRVVDMLTQMVPVIGGFEEQNPDAATEAVLVVFLEGTELVIASNKLHPDTVNMLLDIAKLNLLMGQGHAVEEGDDTVH